MKSYKLIQILAITAVLLAGCKEETAQQEAVAQETGGLKDAFKAVYTLIRFARWDPPPAA